MNGCLRLWWLLASGMVVWTILVGSGQTLTWEANGTALSHPADGSGIWLTANDGWNESADVAWTQHRTTGV